MTELPHPVVSQWLAELDRQGKSQLTCTSYRRALVNFARWSEQSYGQPFDPAAIIPRAVADWKAYQQTVEKAKPSTVNQRLVALSRFFKWALRTAKRMVYAWPDCPVATCFGASDSRVGPFSSSKWVPFRWTKSLRETACRRVRRRPD